MLTIEELLEFYREQGMEQPPPTEYRFKDVITSTLAYLNGYKQARLMLLELGKTPPSPNAESGESGG